MAWIQRTGIMDWVEGGCIWQLCCLHGDSWLWVWWMQRKGWRRVTKEGVLLGWRWSPGGVIRAVVVVVVMAVMVVVVVVIAGVAGVALKGEKK